MLINSISSHNKKEKADREVEININILEKGVEVEAIKRKIKNIKSIDIIQNGVEVAVIVDQAVVQER